MQFDVLSRLLQAKSAELDALDKLSWSTRTRKPRLLSTILSRLHEPASDVIDVSVFIRRGPKMTVHVIYLLRRFLAFARIGRISADVSLTSLVLEVDLRLIERCVKRSSA